MTHTPVTHLLPRFTRLARQTAALAILAFAATSMAHAQSPWERAVTVLADTFTGPIAKGLSLVAVVVGGLGFAYGEGDSKRMLAGIIFGVGMALGAAQFLAWLFL